MGKMKMRWMVVAMMDMRAICWRHGNINLRQIMKLFLMLMWNDWIHSLIMIYDDDALFFSFFFLLYTTTSLLRLHILYFRDFCITSHDDYDLSQQKCPFIFVD